MTARRQFYVELASAAMLFTGLGIAMFREDYWNMGWIVPAVVLKFWQLYQRGEAAG